MSNNMSLNPFNQQGGDITAGPAYVFMLCSQSKQSLYINGQIHLQIKTW